MPLDPRHIQLDTLLAEMVSAAENGSLNPFLPLATKYNQQIGYAFFRKEDMAEIFVRFASDYQRFILPRLTTDVEAAVTHFHDNKKAKSVIQRLKNAPMKHVESELFADIVDDPRITKLFTETPYKKKLVSAKYYDKTKSAVAPLITLPDLKKPQNRVITGMKIISRSQSFDEFIEDRRLKISDVNAAIEQCIKEKLKVSTPQSFLFHVPIMIAKQKCYPRELGADLVGDIIKTEMSPPQRIETLKRITDYVFQLQGGLVVAPHKINTHNLQDGLTLLRIFRDAGQGLAPNGLSSHGGPVPAARVKELHLGSGGPRRRC